MKTFLLSGLDCWWNEIPLEDKIPTVAIHGGCATGEIWRGIEPHFTLRNIPFFAIGLPGHETFKDGLGRLTIGGYTVDVTHFLDGSIRSPCNLLGHSMGGLICQHLGEREQIKRMALIGTPPVGVPLLNFSLGLSALKYIPAFLFGWPWKYTWKDFLKLYGNGLDKQTAKRLFNESVQESGWVARQMLLGRPRRVPQICGDIGIFSALADNVVPPMLQHRMVDMYQHLNRKVEMFSLHGGHMSIFGPGQEASIHKIIDWLYPAR